MSWFSTGLDKLNELSEKAKTAAESAAASLPPIDNELLNKLTLNTDEMKATRLQFGEEATRRDQVKNMLAGMLPWETKDPEREILVEECKEAILALSHSDDTFFGPYEMPLLDVQVEEDDDESGEENEEKEEEEGSEKGDDEDSFDEDKKPKHPVPTPDSLEKLAKLEPLPPLLQEFDLDSHVGLIQRLLKEDPNLVTQQSVVGGGSREKIFWQNYFFHCAFTRYEAGLSIDEIWSFNPDAHAVEEGTAAAEPIEQSEETVVFDDVNNGGLTTGSEFVAKETPTKIADEPLENSFTAAVVADQAASSPNVSVGTSEFEMVEEATDDIAGDPALDELEAEIARELEN